MTDKVVYEKQYQTFRKLLQVSGRELPLAEIIGFIDKIVVDAGREIVVRWVKM